MANEPVIAEVAKIAHLFGPRASGRVVTRRQYFRTSFECYRPDGYYELCMLATSLGSHIGRLHER